MQSKDIQKKISYQEILDFSKRYFDGIIIDEKIFKECTEIKIDNHNKIVYITTDTTELTPLQIQSFKKLLKDVKKYLELINFSTKIKFVPQNNVPQIKVKIDKKREHFNEYLNELYTFQNFVVSNCNAWAYKVCLNVTKGIEEARTKNCTSILICAKEGMGKTHLLQATARELYKKGEQVLYISADNLLKKIREAYNLSKSKYTNEDIYRSNKPSQEIDYLLIDDFQEIDTFQEKSKMGFYINKLLKYIKRKLDRGKIVILASSKEVGEFKNSKIKEMLDKFMVISITNVDKKFIKEYISKAKKEKQELKNILTNEVIDFILKNHWKFTNIALFVTFMNTMSLPFFTHSVPLKSNEKFNYFKKYIWTPFWEARSTFKFDLANQLIAATSHVLKINNEKDLINGKKRTQKISKARRIIIFILKNHFKKSFNEIAQLLNIDKSSVRYGYNKIIEEIKNDKYLEKKIEEIRRKIM